MQKRYTTKEILTIAGIARATLYNWLKDGKIPEVQRDRNNYRIFSEEDLKHLVNYKNLTKGPIQSYLVREEMLKKGKKSK